MKTICLAGCIIQDPNGKILLLHRNTAKRKQWEIPGGKIDEGEDAKTTAIREVKEELDIDVEILSELDTKTFKEDDYEMKYTWFSTRVLSGTPKVMEIKTHDEFKYFSFSELEKLGSELSPNARNFVEEFKANRTLLDIQ